MLSQHPNSKIWGKLTVSVLCSYLSKLLQRQPISIFLSNFTLSQFSLLQICHSTAVTFSSDVHDNKTKTCFIDPDLARSSRCQDHHVIAKLSDVTRNVFHFSNISFSNVYKFINIIQEKHKRAQHTNFQVSNHYGHQIINLPNWSEKRATLNINHLTAYPKNRRIRRLPCVDDLNAGLHVWLRPVVGDRTRNPTQPKTAFP